MSKIACIGNSTFDTFEKIKDSKGIKIDQKMDIENNVTSVGGPANNGAYTIKVLNDSKVYFYGQVGNDEYGKEIIKRMNEEGINVDNLNIEKDLITPNSFIVLSKNEQTGESERTIFTARDKRDAKIYSDLNYETNKFDAILTDGKYLNETLQLIKANPNAKVIIDAGRVNNNVLTLCQYVNYIICSEDFAINYLRQLNLYQGPDKIDITSNIYKEIFLNLQNQFPNAKLVITIGENGCIFSEDNINIEILPPLANLNVVDVNGAGDIFHGAFTSCIINYYSFRESLLIATITASLSTQNIGGRNSVPKPSSVFEAYKDIKYYNQKLLKKRKS